MTNQPFENQPQQPPQMPPPGYQPPQGEVPGYQQQPPPGYQQPPPGYQQQPPPGYPQPELHPAQDIQQNKMYAILAYLGILWLVSFLAGPKNSPFLKFHLNQGLVLHICGIGGYIAAVILSAILTAISWTLLTVGSLIMAAVGIAYLVFAIMGIVNANQGKMTPLPLIGGWTLLK
ncbi:MAG: DUF4870 domain-containing protein [Propionibacteriaceae bacterium]|nr:DUF4870 domain-containing protein [Propionibacteriaceae bacterium]